MGTSNRPRSPAGAGGQRASAQRRAVADWLATHDGFSSAQDIHAALRASGVPIGLATVYRHMQSFAEQGLVDVVPGADGQATYRLCGDGAGSHHHHLICRACGRTEEVQGKPVERWAHDTAHAHGYTHIEHTVEIFGICPACAAEPR